MRIAIIISIIVLIMIMLMTIGFAVFGPWPRKTSRPKQQALQRDFSSGKRALYRQAYRHTCPVSYVMGVVLSRPGVEIVV